VEAQQKKNAITMLFRQGEMASLLKGCTSGLEQAVDVFMVNYGSVSVCELINSIPTDERCRSGQGYQ
jgi:hypothetical protein